MPISTAMVELLEARKAGVASDVYVFARAITNEFDRQVSRACRQAAKQANISYGRFDGDGFTFHSLRHTYITHLLANGVDAPTVMEYSGHKSYQSFSVYLHKTDLGEKRACLILETVDGFLTGCELNQNEQNDKNSTALQVHPLQNHKNADQSRSVA